MRHSPLACSIHIEATKLSPKNRLQQIDRLYQSVTVALHQLVAAVGLKVNA
jgi:hypothetical protein